MDPFRYLCLSLLYCLACPMQSSAGNLLSLACDVCHLLIWPLGSGMVPDCIDS